MHQQLLNQSSTSMYLSSTSWQDLSCIFLQHHLPQQRDLVKRYIPVYLRFAQQIADGMQYLVSGSCDVSLVPRRQLSIVQTQLIQGLCAIDLLMFPMSSMSPRSPSFPMPPTPQNPQLPKVPNVSNVPNVPTVPKVPNVPKSPISPTPPKSPTLPVGQSSDPQWLQLWLKSL